jgi:hypothetical protein
LLSYTIIFDLSRKIFNFFEKYAKIFKKLYLELIFYAILAVQFACKA